MGQTGHNTDTSCSISMPPKEFILDFERDCSVHSNLPALSQPTFKSLSSPGQQGETNAAYFQWPSRYNVAEERADYFSNLQKGVLPETFGQLRKGQQATTLLELMIIRAFHSKFLNRYCFGTAIGFRIRAGALTDIPAILAFVSRKVHKQWLSPIQCLPTVLEGPGGMWCDVDVVEFSYFSALKAASTEQLCTDMVDDLSGGDPQIGSGSQIATQENFGTLGAIVRSQTGNRQVGFLTTRQVAVNLDYPSQKMFHPLPPTLGPTVYLGAVKRATSFVRDDLWYGVFAGRNPETFVRADGAFVHFADDFDMSTVTTSVKGVGHVGDLKIIDLQSPISSLIGKQVMKVGRSSGLTSGTVLAYALEYNDEKGICLLTDFLLVGDNQQPFALEVDSGSLILIEGENGKKPQPIGIIWGGTANRGQLKLRVGQPPVVWTSGVDLHRLLNLLELDIITMDEGLRAAVQDQRATCAMGINPIGAVSSSTNGFQSLDLRIKHIPFPCSSSETYQSLMETDFLALGGVKMVPSVEHRFTPSLSGSTPVYLGNQPNSAVLANPFLLGIKSNAVTSASLQLHDNEAKRHSSDASRIEQG